MRLGMKEAGDRVHDQLSQESRFVSSRWHATWEGSTQLQPETRELNNIWIHLDQLWINIDPATGTSQVTQPIDLKT